MAYINGQEVNDAILVRTTGGGGGEIADGAVTTAKIANGAVTTPKIADNAVTNAKLSTSVQNSLAKADTALQTHQDISGKADIKDIPTALSDLTEDSTHRTVTDTQIATWNGKQNALTAGDNITITNNVISSTGGSGITDGSVTTAKIANNAVTEAKLSTSVQEKLNSSGGTFDVSKVYYVGEPATGGGTEPDPPSGEPEDITSHATNLGADMRGYWKFNRDTGVLEFITSSAYHNYMVDVEAYTPTSATLQSKIPQTPNYNDQGIGGSFVCAFFTSKEVFDATTYIENSYIVTPSTTAQTISISSIPTGAKAAVFTNYISHANFAVYGYATGQSSSQTRSRSVTVEEATAEETTIKTVSDAITQWNTDGKPNAIIHKEAMIPTRIYRVGSGRTYATLVAAVAQWVTDGKPIATIYVDSGTYISISNPSDAYGATGVNIVGSTNRLTIIGEDRDSTIVKSTTGKYIHPAIDIKGGNVTIKNMTFIADHSDNANFVYLDPDRPDKPNSAYAIHCDGGSTPGVIGGVIEFENCNMWSWQSQGLGCGTVPNGQVIVRNCDIRSFVPGYASGTGLNEEEYAKYLHGTRGAIIYHTSPSTATSHEGFTLINSSIYIKGGTTPIKLMNDNGSNKSGIKMLTFINNTFWNGIETQNVINVPSGFTFNKLSSGNNISTVNSAGSGYALLIE